MDILRKKSLCALVFMLSTLNLNATQEASASGKEDSMKAAFVYNFIKYTTWPKLGSSINVCAVGGGGLSDALKKSISGKKVKSAALKFVAASSAKNDCQVVVFTSSAKSQDIGAVNTSPVLTISDSKGFVDKGGIVEFMNERNKVRFNVNNKSAKKAKLKLSVKMLSAAKSVKQ